jgi:uncharacterized protein (TIGR00369 family)
MANDHDPPNPEHNSLPTGPHRFKMDQWISCAPFEKLLHIDIVEAADGRAVLQMPFLVDFAQGAGLMHGGALVALADTAVVMAIKSIVPPQTHFATVAMETVYQRPVTEGIVTARSQVAAVKGRILDGRARVFDQHDRQVLGFRATFKIARDARIRSVAYDPIDHRNHTES